MRANRLVEVAIGLLASSLLLQAQHGSAIGGMSSPHIGAGPRSFAPPSRPIVANPSLPAARLGHSPSGSGAHRSNDGRGTVKYRQHYPAVYAGYPWLAPFGYGLPFADGIANGDDQDAVSSQQPLPPPENADPQTEVAAYASSPFRPPYQGQVAPAPVHEQPATTLIFKDGRPSTQVHNYALTSDTLYAFDGESRQEIPLSMLNVPATVAANRTAGVDFALPVNR